jgi:hypothetical protein
LHGHVFSEAAILTLLTNVNRDAGAYGDPADAGVAVIETPAVAAFPGGGLLIGARLRSTELAETIRVPPLVSS